jgi:hypothetical protein
MIAEPHRLSVRGACGHAPGGIEQVVAGAVPAGAPEDRHLGPGEMVRPVTDIVPAAGLEAEMVEAGGGGAEDREAVMFLIGAQEARGAGFVLATHPVGDAESETVGGEGGDPFGIAGGDHDMLQAAGAARCGWGLAGRPEGEAVAVRIGDGESARCEEGRCEVGGGDVLPFQCRAVTGDAGGVAQVEGGVAQLPRWSGGDDHATIWAGEGDLVCVVAGHREVQVVGVETRQGLGVRAAERDVVQPSGPEQRRGVGAGAAGAQAVHGIGVG